jgi:hypothetical protein
MLTASRRGLRALQFASAERMPSWAPSIATVRLSQPRRHMGILDSLKGLAENRQKESLDKKKRA